jgi:hypothetical protein
MKLQIRSNGCLSKRGVAVSLAKFTTKVHQGVPEFVYFFAENTKITPNLSKFKK